MAVPTVQPIFFPAKRSNAGRTARQTDEKARKMKIEITEKDARAIDNFLYSIGVDPLPIRLVGTYEVQIQKIN